MLEEKRIEENKKEIISLLQSTQREGIECIISFLENSDFFSAPASSKYHNNFDGGLADHSLKVYKTFKKLNEIFNKGKNTIKEDSIIITALLHDLCKVNYYEIGKKNICKGKDANGYKIWEAQDVWDVKDKLGLGHGEKSIILILENGIKLTDFEKYTIRWHMNLPESYEDRMAYNAAKEQCPNMILLHIADLISSSLYEVTAK